MKRILAALLQYIIEVIIFGSIVGIILAFGLFIFAKEFEFWIPFAIGILGILIIDGIRAKYMEIYKENK